MEHAPTWLVNSLIYLSAAVIAVPLSKALGLGSIIGYLAAGIAIGPWGLKLVSNVEDILHFAEFGVVLMLFLVGLELDPKRLWSLRRPIFGWGTAQVLGCAALLLLAAALAGVPWRIGLVAALGLALSSTAIALQVLGERNLLPTSSGQAGFSILLFQDVAAIPILALLPLLGGVSEANEAVAPASRALEAIKIVAVIAGIILGGRLVLRPLLRWTARSNTPEIFTAASLLLVVAIAALMQFVGLSMALGAFLAGVLLAESEYRRELETDIEPFKGLLLGLFFIAVGMSIDFGVLARSPLLMAGIVFGFLAVKAAVIYSLAKWMELPFLERPVFTLLLAQGGEFAFVVFQAAAGAQVFSAETASLLIGAVALSMLLSPLLLVVLDKLVLPRFADCNTGPKLDEIAELQNAPVIIAGFGRYGQIVARVLRGKKIPFIALENSAEQVDLVQKFGSKAFYGDASRPEILEAAQIGKARAFIIAIDNVEASLRAAEYVRRRHPDVPVYARARNRNHAHRLLDAGVANIQRETFLSALETTREMLVGLGFGERESERVIETFREHDERRLLEDYAHYSDMEKLQAKARSDVATLEQLFAEDTAVEARETGTKPRTMKSPASVLQPQAAQIPAKPAPTEPSAAK